MLMLIILVLVRSVLDEEKKGRKKEGREMSVFKLVHLLVQDL